MRRSLVLVLIMFLLHPVFAQVNEKDLPPRPTPPRLVNDLADAEPVAGADAGTKTGGL